MAEPAFDLRRLAQRASAPAVALARRVLEQDVADAAWAIQVGPALSQGDVAILLGKSEQAVSKDPHLLRIRNRDGRPVYPVMQFDGRRPLPGLSEVLAVLYDALEPLTIASWLTAPQRSLAGARPLDVLRDGQPSSALTVISAARRLARAAG